MRKRQLIAAAAFGLASLAIGTARLSADAPPAARWLAEGTIGLDGGAAALFLMPERGGLSTGLRLGLGFESADLRPNDPALALALRFGLLYSQHWEGWVGAEAGALFLDTGYDRFALPLVGASAGLRFRFPGRLYAFTELGARYGRRDRLHQARLAFLDTRHVEATMADPLLFRLGLALRF